MERSASGQQWTITHGEWQAVVVEVGGGIRTLTRGGQDVVAGYGVDEMAPSGRGQVLMPWPNRVRDGRYTWDGMQLQLPITEVKTGNASHGLVRWALWELLDQAPDAVTVGYRLHPQPGWPFQLDLCQTYRLDDDGLTVEVSATNVGDTPAPFGFGAHPYLFIGDADAAAVRLTIPAARSVDVDERLLPTGLSEVAGTDLDFRQARPLGETELDTAFTDIEREADGRWRVRVDAPGHRAACVWGGEGLDWLQVFTAKARAGTPVPHGIAVEPMSCPADALRSGQGLVTLEPGRSWTARWGIAVS